MLSICAAASPTLKHCYATSKLKECAVEGLIVYFTFTTYNFDVVEVPHFAH
jgi:hypothetical protein